MWRIIDSITLKNIEIMPVDMDRFLNWCFVESISLFMFRI